MTLWFWRLAFVSAACAALVLAGLPNPPIPAGTNDKTLHMVGFAVLAGLAIPAFPKLSLIALFWILAVFGAGIEAIQSIPALGRAPSFEDWLADILGAGAILLVVGGILRGLVAGQAKD